MESKDQKVEETQKTTQEVPKTDVKEEAKTEATAPTEGLLEDFARLDIRVGKITECWKHPDSDKLWCEKIDLGDEVREIGSGLQKFVKLEDMSGLVIVLANLKPRKLGGIVFPTVGLK